MDGGWISEPVRDHFHWQFLHALYLREHGARSRGGLEAENKEDVGTISANLLIVARHSHLTRNCPLAEEGALK